MRNFTYANILEGQITLDRAIKHIVNRAGHMLPRTRMVIVGDGFTSCPDLEAVTFLESKWHELEATRVQKIRASRLKKKAGEA